MVTGLLPPHTVGGNYSSLDMMLSGGLPCTKSAEQLGFVGVLSWLAHPSPHAPMRYCRAGSPDAVSVAGTIPIVKVWLGGAGSSAVGADVGFSIVQDCSYVAGVDRAKSSHSKSCSLPTRPATLPCQYGSQDLSHWTYYSFGFVANEAYSSST